MFVDAVKMVEIVEVELVFEVDVGKEVLRLFMLVEEVIVEFVNLVGVVVKVIVLFVNLVVEIVAV